MNNKQMINWLLNQKWFNVVKYKDVPEDFFLRYKIKDFEIWANLDNTQIIIKTRFLGRIKNSVFTLIGNPKWKVLPKQEVYWVLTESYVEYKYKVFYDIEQGEIPTEEELTKPFKDFAELNKFVQKMYRTSIVIEKGKLAIASEYPLYSYTFLLGDMMFHQIAYSKREAKVKLLKEILKGDVWSSKC